MIPYEDFISELNRTIKYDAEFYRDLLEKVIDNPRACLKNKSCTKGVDMRN